MVLKKFKEKVRRNKLERHGIGLDVRLETTGYGERSGLWHVFPAGLDSHPVVYSFGVGNNVTWDLAMIENHNAELHAFDPTPRSVEWISSQTLPDAFHFHPVGLSDSNGEIEFFVPHREHKVNYSSYKSRRPDGKSVSCPVKRLENIVQELGHHHIDVLKMDIEGAESAAIPDIINSKIKIGQLLVEFHYMYPNISFESFVGHVNFLRENGFRIFHISTRGYEFSFIHESRL